MSDQNLAITGKDVSIELLLDGVPQKVIDQVVSFSEDAQTQKIETRHLGTINVDVEHIPDGWGGEIEVSRKTRQLDDFLDAVRVARANRVPVLIVIVSTKRYNDGTSVTHTYPDCKVEMSTRGSRGQNVTSRLMWRCGVERIST